MKRSPYISIGIILAAGALGFAMRGLLRPPPEEVVKMTARPGQSISKDSSPGTPPLVSETSETLQTLAKDLRGAWLAENPYRAQAAAVLRILRGAKTPDDFTAALELVANEAEETSLEEHFVAPLAEILFKRWAAIDPAAAMLATSRMAGRQTVSRLRFEIAKIWGAKDAPAALEFMLGQPDPFRHDATFTLFQELGGSNPAQAIALAQETGAKGVKMDLVALVLRPWSTQDPRAAVQWVMTAMPVNKRLESLEACLQGSVWSLGMAETAEMVSGLEMDQSDRDALLGRLVENGISWPKDPQKGLKAVASIHDDETRRRALKQIASLGNYPDSQTEALISGLPEGPDREAFLAGHARNSIDTNELFLPAEALSRIERVNDAKAQDELWRELGGVWGGRDPVSARQWLKQEPAGPRRDAVTGEFVRSLIKTDPEAALLWSTSIADPGKRSRRLAELFPKWAEQDDPAAAAWLESAPVINEDERTKLRSALK